MPVLAAVMVLFASSVAGDGFADAAAFARTVRTTLRPEVLNADWLRERGDARALAQAKAAAEKVMRGTLSSVGVETNFPDCNVDWGSNATVNGYGEWTWQLNRHGALAQLAHYYTLTNDARAVTAWMRLVRGWIRQMPLPPDGTRYDATLAWRSVDTGIRAACWMKCIHAFVNAPEVTDEFLVEFYRSVRDHGHRLRTGYSWGNWHLSEMKGLVMLAVTSPFLSEAAEWQRFAIGKIDDEMAVQVHPDGFHYELTTHYHRISESEFRDVVRFLRKYGVTPPERLFAGLERMYDVYIKLMRPNRTLPSLNDGEEEGCKWRLFLGSQLFPERRDFRYFFDPPGNRGGVAPQFLSCAMPNSGAIALRNGWGTDAVWAYMDASPLGCHEHEDYLNVLLFAYGKDMIVDAGNYYYDTSAMRDYVLNTRAHNTMIFDGYMQHRSQEKGDIGIPVDHKVPFSFATTPEVDWAGAIYTNAYGDVRERYAYRADRKLFVRHSRKLVFHKAVKGLDPFFVVIDRMGARDGGKPHDYEIMWHLADGAFRMEPNAFSMDFGDGVFLDAFASDRAAAFVDKIGQKKPMQGWKPVRIPGPHEHHPIHTPVLCGRFTGSRRVVTVLYPRKGAACPIRAVRAGEGLSDQTFDLVLADGSTVTLDERDLPPSTHRTLTPSEAVDVSLRRVADSFLSRNPYEKEQYALWWNWATLWWGVTALGLSEPDSRYADIVKGVGEHFNWSYFKAEPVGYYADSQCIGQAYLELALAGKIGMDKLAEFRGVLDKVGFEAPATGDSLDWDVKGLRRWKWCDALFMAPTAFARMSSLTGDPRYRAFADSEYRATADFLFNRKWSLFHRDSRYFDKTCANGKPEFWSRGNGWVFASLAIMLRDMPQDWPTRGFYLGLYRRMAKSIREAQTADGTWHASLLAPGENGNAPEMSGTCLHLFGFLRGLNSGLLDETEYGPVVDRAWRAVSAAVTPSGHLGQMQKMAAAPGAAAKDEEAPYGVGAFLAAGVEMKSRLVQREFAWTKRIAVSDPSGQYVARKDVRVDWMPTGGEAKVFDLRNGAFVPCAVRDGAVTFTTYLPAGATREFLVGEER